MLMFRHVLYIIPIYIYPVELYVDQIDLNRDDDYE